MLSRDPISGEGLACAHRSALRVQGLSLRRWKEIRWHGKRRRFGEPRLLLSIENRGPSHIKQPDIGGQRSSSGLVG